MAPPPFSASQRLDSASLAALLERAQADPLLHTLSLRHAGLTPNLTVQVADFLEANSSVTALDLTGNAIGSHGAGCLAASLEKNNTLQQLTLAGCGLKSDVVAPLAALFQKPTTHSPLRSIDLSNNQIDDEAAVALRDLVVAMARREPHKSDEFLSLDLRKNWLAEDAIRALASAMQSNYTLLTMRVEGNQDEDATVARKQIAFCLQRNRAHRERRLLLDKIRALGDSSQCIHECKLECIELTLSDAQLLSDALRNNRSLVALTLRDNALPSEATRRIVRALETHPSLQRLWIHDNEVGDVGFVAMDRLLQRSRSLVEVAVRHSVHAPPTTTSSMSRLTLASLHHTLARDTLSLRILVLVNCGLDDLAIGVVISGVAWACCLEALDLHNNQISDRSAQVLARMLQRCSRLHTLDVTGNALTLDGALTLARATQHHASMRTLRLGRFPHYEATVIDSLVACLQASATLVRVELATKTRASRCADLVSELVNGWRTRREAFEREWTVRQSQQRVLNLQRAAYRTLVRSTAYQVVLLWMQRYTEIRKD